MNKLPDPNAAAPVRALAPGYYVDPEVFEREKERIFFRTWQFAAHASQLEHPGDYVVFEICGQNLFVLRGSDNELRGFYNVCQHRAHELLQGTGNVRLIACPYHAWTYTTDGRLKKARNADKVPGFDADRICLTAVRVEQFCGFVFVNLDDNAVPMARRFAAVSEQVRGFVAGLDELKLAHEHSAREDCNWKVAVENYNECYHCPVVHRDFTRGVVEASSYNVSTQGEVLRHTARSSTHTAYQVEPQAAHSEDYSSWYLWPSFSVQVYPGNVVNTYHWRPQTVDRTIVHRQWFVAGGKLTAEHEKLIEFDRTTTFTEDLSLVNSVQRGLNSRGYRPGPLVIDPGQGVNSEHSIQAFYAMVLGALGDGGPG